MAGLAGNPGEKGAVPGDPHGHQGRLGCDLIKESTTSILEFLFSPGHVLPEQARADGHLTFLTTE